MSEAEPVRENTKLKARLEEVERCLKACLTAIKHAENELDIEIMPTGEYYGSKFD